MKISRRSPLNFLPRRIRGLGPAFSEMVSLGRGGRVRRGSDRSSWQETFLPQVVVSGEEKLLSHWVSIALALAACGIALLLATRLWQLQVAYGQENLQASEGNRVRIRVIPAPRGVIYDRQGNVLASNSPGFRLVGEIVGLTKKRREDLADYLSGLTGIPAAEMAQKLSIKEAEVIIKSGLSRDEALPLELKLKDYPEIRVAEEPVRSYPNGVTLAHLLGYLGEISPEELVDPKYAGYVSGSKIGRSGIESSYEYLLHGQDGRELVEVDSLGRTERIIKKLDPLPGRNIVLTVDLATTRTLQDELVKQLKRAGSEKGAVVALDPRDGSVLAYVSWPSFDPNLFSRGISQKDYDRLVSDPNQPLFDRVISGTYPPGSTFKPTVATAALSSGVTTKDRLIESPGVVYLGTQAFHNWLASGFGRQGIVDAITYSNDVYFYYMGAELGVDRLGEWARKFGFGEKTGIKLSGEASGLIPSQDWKEQRFGEVWYPGDNYNFGIGQGFLLVTPLQLANDVAAIGNWGHLYQPILIKEVRDNANLVVSRDNPKLIRDNLTSREVLQTVKEGMKKACVPFVNLAGDTGCKTGSAEFGGEEKTHAWFVTFAPWENPEITIAVLIEGGGHGSIVSSPVTRPILAKYLNK